MARKVIKAVEGRETATRLGRAVLRLRRSGVSSQNRHSFAFLELGGVSAPAIEDCDFSSEVFSFHFSLFIRKPEMTQFMSSSL